MAVLLGGQVSYAQEDEEWNEPWELDGANHDTHIIEEHVVDGLTFQVDTYKSFSFHEEKIIETEQQMIITPLGSEIPGMPDGLGCAPYEKTDSDRCKVRGFRKVSGFIYLITTRNIYTYSIAVDGFTEFGEVSRDIGPPLEGADDIFLMPGYGNETVVGLLLGFYGAWVTVDLPRAVSLDEPFTIKYRGDQIIFRFSLFRRMVCSRRDRTCVLRGFKESE